MFSIYKNILDKLNNKYYLTYFTNHYNNHKSSETSYKSSFSANCLASSSSFVVSAWRCFETTVTPS